MTDRAEIWHGYALAKYNLNIVTVNTELNIITEKLYVINSKKFENWEKL